MARHVHRAEVLSIGSELTVGDTRDTNAGDLARDLAAAGVTVGRITTLPDDLDAVADAWRGAMARVDLVISTGGLGPTPDDLTREAIALVLDETPTVDPRLERWLRALWRRRRLPFPEINLKQAWLIPSATSIPNANGTAPGWWVDGHDGVVLVALPGPPREMRPMWEGFVLPRLRESGLGDGTISMTLRTAGIGESQLAAVLGEDLLASVDPSVATYARADAVDVRIAATSRDGLSAEELLATTERQVRDLIGAHVWGTGAETWADAIGVRLAGRSWTLAIAEVGTAGSCATLLADVEALRGTESRPADPSSDRGTDPLYLARRVAQDTVADVGLGIVASPAGADTRVDVAVVTPLGEHREERMAFLGGSLGRHRAGLAAAAILLGHLDTTRD